MRRRLLELLLYLAPALVGLFSAPLLARALGPDGRGEYALALAVASFAVTFGALGQAELHSHEIRSGTSDRARRARWTAIGGVAAALGGLLFLVYVLRVDVGSSLMAMMLVPIIAFAGLWRAEHVARGTLLSVSVQNALSAVARLAFVAILFWVGSLDVTSAILSTQLPAALAAIALWVTVRSFRAGGRGGRDGSKPTSSRAALAVLTFAALTAILLRSDLVVLQLTSSTEQVGLYAAAVGLSESALAASAAFKARIQAALYGDQPMIRVKRELILLHVVIVPALVLGALLADQIVSVLFGEEFRYAGDVLRVLMVAAYFQVIMDCGTGSLVVLGERVPMVRVSALGAVVAIATLIPLTSASGAIGAAWSSTFAYAVTGIAAFFIVWRNLRTGDAETAGDRP